MIITPSLMSQLKEGSRIATTNIGFDFTGSKQNITNFDTTSSAIAQNSFYVNLGFGIGKLKNNRLLTYGISISDSYNNGINSGVTNAYTITASVSYQKFYPITDKLYFTPLSNLYAGYSHSRSYSALETTNGFTTGIIFYPIAVTFCRNSTTNFVFYVGNFDLEYNYLRNYKDNLIPGTYKMYSSSLNINSSFTGFGVMLQKVFK